MRRFGGSGKAFPRGNGSCQKVTGADMLKQRTAGIGGPFYRVPWEEWEKIQRA